MGTFTGGRGEDLRGKKASLSQKFLSDKLSFSPARE